MSTLLHDRVFGTDAGVSAFDRLGRDTFACLSGIPVLPRRIVLDTPGVEAHVPMLRGVWGAALHAASPDAYEAVFTGRRGPDGAHVPGYVLRPAPPDPVESPAVEWLLLGDAVRHDAPACRAWEDALLRGLGPDRRSAQIRSVRILLPASTEPLAAMPARDYGIWTLDAVRWPLQGDPPTTPCRIVFDAPLRLLRKGLLITEPTLADIVLGLCRRISALAHPDALTRLDPLRHSALALAKAVPSAPWAGRRHDLVRYSGNQKAEVDMHGVSGWLDLPAGPGSLWPLLAAGQWLHVGKGTVFGLGQLRIEPCAPP